MIVNIIFAVAFLATAICLFRANYPKSLIIFLAVSAVIAVVSIWVQLNWPVLVIWVVAAILVVLLRLKTGLAITVIALFLIAFGLISSGFFKTAKSPPTKTEEPTQEVTEKGGFVIKLPRRDGNRLNADGAVRGDAEAFRAQIARQAKEDPLTLYLYYMASPLGEKEPLKSEAVLAKDGRIENGNLYSEEGKTAYYKWLALWEITGIEAVEEISFQGTNTGVDENGTKVTQSSGVTGEDKEGYDITYRDAFSNVIACHSALCRCTQPTAGEGIPGVPEGPTDNPEPPEKPSEPSEPELAPKSENPADYRQPGDSGKGADVGTGTKPKAFVSTPAESSPPKVETRKESTNGNGSGVTDAVTNPPGSETGGSAPGATGDTDRSKVPPKESEGGSSEVPLPDF